MNIIGDMITSLRISNGREFYNSYISTKDGFKEYWDFKFKQFFTKIGRSDDIENYYLFLFIAQSIEHYLRSEKRIEELERGEPK